MPILQDGIVEIITNSRSIYAIFGFNLPIQSSKNTDNHDEAEGEGVESKSGTESRGEGFNVEFGKEPSWHISRETRLG